MGVVLDALRNLVGGTSQITKAIENRVGIGDVAQWANNALTGQLDFDRQMELQNDAQEFNSAEAKLAYEREVEAAKNSTLWQADQYRALGINPAWAMTGGGQASTASVSAPAAKSNVGVASKSGGQVTGLVTGLANVLLTAATVGANNVASAIGKIQGIKAAADKSKSVKEFVKHADDFMALNIQKGIENRAKVLNNSKPEEKK